MSFKAPEDEAYPDRRQRGRCEGGPLNGLYMTTFDGQPKHYVRESNTHAYHWFSGQWIWKEDT